MKKVRIAKGTVGLVSRKGEYQRCLLEGTHWIGLFSQVKVYDQSKPFIPTHNLKVLLQDSMLAEQVQLIEVADHEIALQYQEGNFQQILPAGQYAFWKGINDFVFQKIDLSKVEITEDISRNTLMKVSILHYVRIFEVQSFQKGLLFIDGTFEKELEPGSYFFWKNAIPVEVKTIDTRQLQVEVLGQEILTKDKANLRINFNTNYRIVDIHKALRENNAYEKQLYTCIQLALREYVGALTMDELLEKKESASSFIREVLEKNTADLGLKIKDCGIKDIILPGDVKEIMNKVLVAQKTAQANTITRREETASTRSLLNTAKLMEENEMLFKLKEMEYVEKISDKINSITLSGGSQIIDQLKDIFSK